MRQQWGFLQTATKKLQEKVFLFGLSQRKVRQQWRLLQTATKKLQKKSFCLIFHREKWANKGVSYSCKEEQTYFCVVHSFIIIDGIEATIQVFRVVQNRSVKSTMKTHLQQI